MVDDVRPRVGLVSLENWDDVWRRNQHLASRLVADGVVASLVFVTPPPAGGALRAVRHRPCAGVEVIVPPLVVPRSHGGHRVLARWLRRALADVDVLWVNDPVAGAPLAGGRRRVVYDVTDDWRAAPQSATDRARIIAAEDILAARAVTVVCSDVLAERWLVRYGVRATLIHNGVDTAAIRAANPVLLSGPGPHAVYVGTLHSNRVDVDLVVALAASVTVHLVGPDGLEPHDHERLDAAGVRRYGPVPSADVPGWLSAADVLICPHLVDDFTLSLDAIKSYEYLATDRPVVATASSGFQTLVADGLTVIDAPGFAAAVVNAARLGPVRRRDGVDWSDRAAEFGHVLTTRS